MSDSIFDFDRIIDRGSSSSEKWDKYRGRDIIPLWVADMDFRSPPAVITALHERVEHGIFGYTHAPQSLVEAVLEHLLQNYNWQVQPEWLLWLPGLVCGINILCRSVGDVGDEVITFTPVYPPFMSAPALSQRTTVKIPLKLDRGRWVADLEAFEQGITSCTKLLLLCSPHNPVGRAWSQKELQQFADVAERHDLVIGSDEIHAGLILEEGIQHIPIATLSPNISCRTITLMAPSKTYNIPGLACAYAVISDPVLRKSFLKVAGRIVPHVNTLGFTAAEAAYRHGEDWRKSLLAYLRENSNLVEETIGGMPGLSTTHVEATYLSWIDCRGIGVENLSRFFEEAGVGLSNGADFGAPGFVRLNFGCSRILLVEALHRLRRAVNQRLERQILR